MDDRPLDRVVLIELLNKLWMHDLRKFLAIIHHSKVSLILLTEPTVKVVLVVGGTDPKVTVEVSLQWLHRLQHQNKPKVNLTVETLHRIAYVLLYKLGSCFHVAYNRTEIIGDQHIH